ncbi:malate synthase A [Agilicoccus flavus]|uniref:malate synthase A n=1 Tax=Agilicoccus flavus TaxID=2775968 RepID=UPI001CF704CF|nr:malate synthase A [Agilicoccus flavus]
MCTPIEIRTPTPALGQDEILTPEALEFVAQLHQVAAGRRYELLRERERRTRAILDGTDPSFARETARVRADDSWRVAPPAPGLEDRRVEITGPTSRKMTINAMNSGAKVWLADLEDASTPSWDNVIGGQLNLRDAVRGECEFTSPDGKEYRVTAERTPTIVVRPRGWHLDEAHLELHGRPLVGGIVDAGLYLFHNAHELIARGRGPYFYLPKTESHLEARLWNDVFVRAQELLGLPRGTIRATVLIETITAAYEMEEILYELREHSSGLNAGRWDYIFSVIKNFRERGEDFVLPDRAQVTMTTPFMRCYTEQLVRACHRRGAHAIGGMAAFIPNRRDPEATEAALEKVRADKSREAADGFDGSWVAHPDLVPVCADAFDAVLGDRPHQVDRLREDVEVDGPGLIDLTIPGGRVTETGLRLNVEVGMRYVESWLRGNGAAAIHNLMEDAATAEISRSQVWQWIRTGTRTDEGRIVTREWVEQIVAEEFAGVERTEGDRFDDARAVFEEVALGEDYPAFLTLPAYERFLAPAPAPVG